MVFFLHLNSPDVKLCAWIPRSGGCCRFLLTMKGSSWLCPAPAPGPRQAPSPPPRKRPGLSFQQNPQEFARKLQSMWFGFDNESMDGPCDSLEVPDADIFLN